MNGYIKFYGEQKISPVHQNIGMEKLVKIRKNLYRQLGVPLLAIRGSEILEFGPAGGHNSLPLILNWGGRSIDLVEPNDIGREELIKCFKDNNVSPHCYKVYSDTMETFRTDKKYDIVIAEQFIPQCENWKELLNILKGFTKKDSIVIITAVEPVGIYIESIKRAVCHYMMQDIEKYEDKVEMLADIFSDSLPNLAGMTRSVREWAEDQIMNPAGRTKPMTMVDAIIQYQDEFDVLGSSQTIFEDFSWFKDMSSDYISAYKEQYDRKKHIFMIYDALEKGSVRDAEENEKLEEAVLLALNHIWRMERDNKFDLNIIFRDMDQVEVAYGTSILKEFHNESKEILRKIGRKQWIDWGIYKTYQQTFGRSSQYISFVKK